MANDKETIYEALGISEKEAMAAAQKFLGGVNKTGTFSGAMETYFGKGQDWVKLVGYKIAVEILFKNTRPPSMVVVEMRGGNPRKVSTPIVDEFGDIIKR
jgi:hypothetical protein